LTGDFFGELLAADILAVAGRAGVGFLAFDTDFLAGNFLAGIFF
jgi:hypothetical protein